MGPSQSEAEKNENITQTAIKRLRGDRCQNLIIVKPLEKHITYLKEQKKTIQRRLV